MVPSPPTTLFVAINAVINSFKLVDHLVIMTKGGPNNASTLLLYYIYEVAFTFQDSAYAATLTVAKVDRRVPYSEIRTAVVQVELNRKDA